MLSTLFKRRRGPEAATGDHERPPAAQDPATEWDAGRWFDHKDFTSDWTSHNFPVWRDLLGQLKDKAIEILEIGSWEGRSAVFFLNYLPRSRLTCVDPFTGNPSFHPGDERYLAVARQSEHRFTQNVAEFGDRVEKIVARSVSALDRLGQAARRFDFIYIDGSHEQVDVLADSALAWPLLGAGGILLWDDYEFDVKEERPKLAIEAFLTVIPGKYEILYRGAQLAIRRL
jgi:predicted O-methyltransferase YrrM